MKGKLYQLVSTEEDEEDCVNAAHPQAEERPFDIFSRPSSYTNLGNFHQSSGDTLTYIAREDDGLARVFDLPRSPSCMAGFRRVHPSEAELELLDWDAGVEEVPINATLGSDEESDPLRINGIINWDHFVQES
jgi:hypothetical protein